MDRLTDRICLACNAEAPDDGSLFLHAAFCSFLAELRRTTRALQTYDFEMDAQDFADQYGRCFLCDAEVQYGVCDDQTLWWFCSECEGDSSLEDDPGPLPTYPRDCSCPNLMGIDVMCPVLGHPKHKIVAGERNRLIQFEARMKWPQKPERPSVCVGPPGPETDPPSLIDSVDASPASVVFTEVLTVKQDEGLVDNLRSIDEDETVVLTDPELAGVFPAPGGLSLMFAATPMVLSEYRDAVANERLREAGEHLNESVREYIDREFMRELVTYPFQEAFLDSMTPADIERVTDHPYSPRPEDPGGNCACGLDNEAHDPPEVGPVNCSDPEPLLCDYCTHPIEEHASGVCMRMDELDQYCDCDDFDHGEPEGAEPHPIHAEAQAHSKCECDEDDLTWGEYSRDCPRHKGEPYPGDRDHKILVDRNEHLDPEEGPHDLYIGGLKQADSVEAGQVMLVNTWTVTQMIGYDGNLDVEFRPSVEYRDCECGHGSGWHAERGTRHCTFRDFSFFCPCTGYKAKEYSPAKAAYVAGRVAAGEVESAPLGSWKCTQCDTTQPTPAHGCIECGYCTCMTEAYQRLALTWFDDIPGAVLPEVDLTHASSCMCAPCERQRKDDELMEWSKCDVPLEEITLCCGSSPCWVHEREEYRAAKETPPETVLAPQLKSKLTVTFPKRKQKVQFHPLYIPFAEGPCPKCGQSTYHTYRCTSTVALKHRFMFLLDNGVTREEIEKAEAGERDNDEDRRGPCEVSKQEITVPLELTDDGKALLFGHDPRTAITIKLSPMDWPSVAPWYGMNPLLDPGDLCSRCGHPRDHHGRPAGCDWISRTPGSDARCGCRHFKEPIEHSFGPTHYSIGPKSASVGADGERGPEVKIDPLCSCGHEKAKHDGNSRCMVWLTLNDDPGHQTCPCTQFWAAPEELDIMAVPACPEAVIDPPEERDEMDDIIDCLRGVQQCKVCADAGMPYTPKVEADPRVENDPPGRNLIPCSGCDDCEVCTILGEMVSYLELTPEERAAAEEYCPDCGMIPPPRDSDPMLDECQCDYPGGEDRPPDSELTPRSKMTPPRLLGDAWQMAHWLLLSVPTAWQVFKARHLVADDPYEAAEDAAIRDGGARITFEGDEGQIVVLDCSGLEWEFIEADYGRRLDPSFTID